MKRLIAKIRPPTPPPPPPISSSSPPPSSSSSPTATTIKKISPLSQQQLHQIEGKIQHIIDEAIAVQDRASFLLQQAQQRTMAVVDFVRHPPQQKVEKLQLQAANAALAGGIVAGGSLVTASTYGLAHLLSAGQGAMFLSGAASLGVYLGAVGFARKCIHVDPLACSKAIVDRVQNDEKIMEKFGNVEFVGNEKMQMITPLRLGTIQVLQTKGGGFEIQGKSIRRVVFVPRRVQVLVHVFGRESHGILIGEAFQNFDLSKLKRTITTATTPTTTESKSEELTSPPAASEKPEQTNFDVNNLLSLLRGGEIEFSVLQVEIFGSDPPKRFVLAGAEDKKLDIRESIQNFNVLYLGGVRKLE